MPVRVHPIDWRDELEQLRPYLNGEGGVVRLQYVDQRCAPSSFLDTLKSEYECKSDGRVWRSLRIDHQVYSVRYLPGIRDEFVRKMGFEPPEPDPSSRFSASFNVFTDVEAGSDIRADISNVSQHIYAGGENPDLMSRERGRWIGVLCQQLAEFLEAGHMMVVVNHGTIDSQDEFWRHLWKGGLENLVARGLLLVHVLELEDKGEVVHDLAPAAELQINLPVALSLGAQLHAIEDMTNIIAREFGLESEHDARLRADTLVKTHVDDIRRLHRQFAALILRLGREAN